MMVGGKQYLTYQLVDAEAGNVVLADKLQLPPADELPVMADRIAMSIVDKKPYAETMEPVGITSTEVAPRFRHPRKPYASLFLTAGYLFYLQPRDPARENFFSNQLVNLNLAVTFETQQMLTMLQMGLMRGNHNEQDITFDLMGNYVFGRGEFAPLAGGGIGITRFSWEEDGETMHNDGLTLSAGMGVLGLRTYYFRLIGAAYVNYTIPASAGWRNTPGLKIMFGVTTPTLGPDATIKMHPGCVGAAIGSFFLTGLVLALVT
jgi:hypothetical protein